MADIPVKARADIWDCVQFNIEGGPCKSGTSLPGPIPTTSGALAPIKLIRRTHGALRGLGGMGLISKPILGTNFDNWGLLTMSFSPSPIKKEFSFPT
jgi:hypothetical protein